MHAALYKNKHKSSTEALNVRKRTDVDLACDRALVPIHQLTTKSLVTLNTKKETLWFGSLHLFASPLITSPAAYMFEVDGTGSSSDQLPRLTV